MHGKLTPLDAYYILLIGRDRRKYVN